MSHEFAKNHRRKVNSGNKVDAFSLEDETLQLVLRTFSSVFPYMSVWQPAFGDLILIGSRAPITPDFEVMEKRFAEPAVKSDLEGIVAKRLDARYMAGRHEHWIKVKNPD